MPTQSNSWPGHICGLFFNAHQKRSYLPQVRLQSHTSITPVCFTTTLTQTFQNPNPEKIDQAQYTFPLYDGVAVNGYTISYADQVLEGVVKQKDAAKQTYQRAVDRGETAGLLESLPAGVFGVTLGNIPSNTAVVVKITYCGELRHDAAIDGLRYTLPTSIAPRYGEYPGELLRSNTEVKGGIAITVDFNMAGSAIRKVQSPSHPTAVAMGETSTPGQTASSFNPSQASATLTLGSTELASDFILQLLIDDISAPQALLETHPALPNHRAIMTTLVPKFTLEQTVYPEIVFIADQSGSMRGSNTAALVASLRVFLKSLPFGVRFNVCAFGNAYEFLWPKSQAYNEGNLKQALEFVGTFDGQRGGTEILAPLQAAFKQKLPDLPLEVLLLTDGKVWAESSIFNFLNGQIRDKAVDARIFALGIGEDVSHSLVEGLARAGKGFAQFVTADEETDVRVMRMLKGALYPHTQDYELEVHYDQSSENASATEVGDDEDFEIIEKVPECLKIEDARSEAGKSNGKKAPKSFFDTSSNVDETTKSNTVGTDRYAHLPELKTPKLLQAPSEIPPLFPFNRTNVHLLLGPETPQKKVSSVILRAKSAEGPLELNIPVHYSPSANGVATIHQLAARKAVQELEEGRGWLSLATTAKTAGGNEEEALKTKHDSRFDELVEREAVRLGEKFQVAGKWTSFVAVKPNGDDIKNDLGESQAPAEPASVNYIRGAVTGFAPGRHRRMGTGVTMFACAPASGPATRMEVSGASASPRRKMKRSSAPRGDFASSPPQQQGYIVASLSSSSFATQNFDRQINSALNSYNPAVVFQSERSRASDAHTPMGPARRAHSPAEEDWDGATASAFRLDSASSEDSDGSQDSDMGLVVSDTSARGQTSQGGKLNVPASRTGHRQATKAMRAIPPHRFRAQEAAPARVPSDDTVRALIDLQQFSGSWAWSPALFGIVGVEEAAVDREVRSAGDKEVFATALVVAYLERKAAEKRAVWELVAQKALVWLAKEVGHARVDKIVEAMGKYL